MSELSVDSVSRLPKGAVHVSVSASASGAGGDVAGEERGSRRLEHLPDSLELRRDALREGGVGGEGGLVELAERGARSSEGGVELSAVGEEGRVRPSWADGGAAGSAEAAAARGREANGSPRAGAASGASDVRWGAADGPGGGGGRGAAAGSALSSPGAMEHLTLPASPRGGAAGDRPRPLDLPPASTSASPAVHPAPVTVVASSAAPQPAAVSDAKASPPPGGFHVKWSDQHGHALAEVHYAEATATADAGDDAWASDEAVGAGRRRSSARGGGSTCCAIA
jgi:hypothetical protein